MRLYRCILHFHRSTIIYIWSFCEHSQMDTEQCLFWQQLSGTSLLSLDNDIFQDYIQVQGNSLLTSEDHAKNKES